ncbi:hypothetical protein BGZ47_003205, partial [Haplosporangium gracile]
PVRAAMTNLEKANSLAANSLQATKGPLFKYYTQIEVNSNEEGLGNNNNTDDDGDGVDDENTPKGKRALDKLIAWLEVECNFKVVFKQERPGVGPRPEMATKGWERAATEINNEMGTDYTGRSMRERSLRHRRTYFQVARWSRMTGAAVLKKSGVDSFKNELEGRCFAFESMDVLSKNNPHLDPACEVSTGRGVVRFSTKAKTVEVRSSTEDNSGTSGKVNKMESWSGAGHDDNKYFEGRESDEDQEDDGQEHQETYLHYHEQAFTSYRL